MSYDAKCPTDPMLLNNIRIRHKERQSRQCLRRRYRATIIEIIDAWVFRHEYKKLVEVHIWKQHICANLYNATVQEDETIKLWIVQNATQALFEYLDSNKGDVVLLGSIQQCARPELKEKAFRYLFDKYNPALIKVVNSRKYYLSEEDAADVVMNVWEYVVEKIDAFKWTGVSIWRWLSSIASKKAFEKRRNIPNDVEFDTQFDGYFYGKLNDDIDTPAVSNEVASEVHEAISYAMEKLSSKDAEIIRYAFFCGYNATEIGLHLNLKPATVRKKKSRAIAQLRKHLAYRDPLG